MLDEQLLHSVPEDVDRLAGESSRVRQVRMHLNTLQHLEDHLLERLSHEIDFKNFDQNLKNLA